MDNMGLHPNIPCDGRSQTLRNVLIFGKIMDLAECIFKNEYFDLNFSFYRK